MIRGGAGGNEVSGSKSKFRVRARSVRGRRARNRVTRDETSCFHSSGVRVLSLRLGSPKTMALRAGRSCASRSACAEVSNGIGPGIPLVVMSSTAPLDFSGSTFSLIGTVLSSGVAVTGLSEPALSKLAAKRSSLGSYGSVSLRGDVLSAGVADAAAVACPHRQTPWQMGHDIGSWKNRFRFRPKSENHY